MKKQMNLFFATTMLFFISTNVNAQIKAGAGLAYGTEIKTLGVTVKATYNIIDEWDGAGSFTFFFPKSEPGVDFKFFELNADAHYIVSQTESLKLYPLAGINIARWTIDYNDFGGIFGIPNNVNDTNVGFNIGGGAELNLTESITGVAELKYTLTSFDQLVFNVGVLLNIGE